MFRADTQPLRAQGIFVEQLYGSGTIDEAKRDALLEPIERIGACLG